LDNNTAHLAKHVFNYSRKNIILSDCKLYYCRNEVLKSAGRSYLVKLLCYLKTIADSKFYHSNKKRCPFFVDTSVCVLLTIEEESVFIVNWQSLLIRKPPGHQCVSIKSKTEALWFPLCLLNKISLLPLLLRFNVFGPGNMLRSQISEKKSRLLGKVLFCCFPTRCQLSHNCTQKKVGFTGHVYRNKNILVNAFQLNFTLNALRHHIYPGSTRAH